MSVHSFSIRRPHRPVAEVPAASAVRFTRVLIRPSWVSSIDGAADRGATHTVVVRGHSRLRRAA